MNPISFVQWLAAAAAGAIAALLVMHSGHDSYWLAPEEVFVLVAGAVFGVLTLLLLRQDRRLRSLERKLTEAESAEFDARYPGTDHGTEQAADFGLGSSRQYETPAIEQFAVQIQGRSEPESARANSSADLLRHQTSSLLNDWAARFGSINLPVKIGVLVLFVGLAALLRYAADQGWLSMPIELRLAGVALLGIVGLWIGWQQRNKQRVFGLSLQGGAIGVLVLTVFAAFRFYDLLPQSIALLSAAALILGGGALAVIQRSQALALFVMIAGFAAPVLLAGDSRNPIGLFTWYAILNVATFAIALKHHWPLLTRLGFLATFVVATLWGVLSWRPEHYWTAQFFLVLFFALYFLVPIVQAKAGQGTDRFDVLLIFGLPLLAFPLQIALLHDNRFGIAFSALAAAVIYLLGARWLFANSQSRPIAQAFAVLAVGLATLAIPFAFSGPTVVMVWALEGAALIWFGCISGRRLARITGLLLIGLAALLWFVLMALNYTHSTWLLLNASGLGGLSLAVAAWLAAWQYERAGAHRIRYNGLFGFGLVFWLLNGFNEVDRFFADTVTSIALVGFCALSVVVTGLIHWNRRWSAAAIASILMLALSVVFVFSDFYVQNPLKNFGWVVWLAMVLIVLLLDRLLASAHSAWRGWISLAGHVAMLAFVSHLIWYFVWTVELAEGWVWLLAGAPLLMLHGWLQSIRRPPLCLSPIDDEQRILFRRFFMIVLIALSMASLASAGDADPLPWLPLLNPLEIAQLVVLVLIVLFVRSEAESDWGRRLNLANWLPAASVFLVLSMAILRSVHQLGDVAWDVHSLFESAQAQASITVLWTLMGVVAWVLGSKQHRPLLWRCGAILLSIVLIKLLLIDRHYLSNVAGILSFVAFGLLSILVGFLAPAPPFEAKPDDAKDSNDTDLESEPK